MTFLTAPPAPEVHDEDINIIYVFRSVPLEGLIGCHGCL
jgi:hypothetical protein